MTVDVLDPPELRIPPARLAQLRRGLLAELERPQPRRPRRLVLAVALLAVLAIAGTAVAVGTDLLAQQKLFHERYPGGPNDPRLVGDYAYVAEGSDWALIAWKSTRGICLDYAVPANGVSGCGFPVAGSPPDQVFHNEAAHAVGYLAGSPEQNVLAVAGPIVPAAESVRVELRDGRTLDAKVYDAPAGLGTPLRFYLLRTDAALQTAAVRDRSGREVQHPLSPVSAVSAYDRDGNLLERLEVP